MRHRLPLLALPCLLACTDAKPEPSYEPDASVPAAPDAGRSDAAKPADRVEVPATSVKVAPLAVDQAAFDALNAQLAEAKKLDAAGLEAKYPTHFEPLGFDPSTAAGLDAIAASRFALTDAERAKLAQNGFVISTRNKFPSFVYGMAQLYSEHLPLYVSADALLAAVHDGYDNILRDLERGALSPTLGTLLANMQQRLPTLDVEAAVKADLDVYLGVALGLLQQKPPRSVAGGDAALMQQLVQSATEAQGLQDVVLFGQTRSEDFSQFTPRGHYVGGLEGYFRAMIWLGRIDFRLLETVEGGKQEFRRPQYLAMLALRELMAADVASYKKVDDTIRTFVGESDYMTPDEVDHLVADLGGAAMARSASDQQVVDAIIAGDYGKQHILSTIAPGDVPGTVLPLNRSFALLGQRYVVDSQVFSDVVDDRVSLRMMPTPLDPAFAALQNAQALGLHTDLAYPGLAGALASSRVTIDAHDSTFWSANLYNLWLSALRGLSTVGSDAPSLMKTEAWGRRMLNAQLGSWAELRHDTILYAKQSYSGMPACAFPDAYIDPYPAFFQALRAYAEAGSRAAMLFPRSDDNSDLYDATVAYFDKLKQASSILGDMVARELRGEPFTAEQLAFINDAVRIEQRPAGCTSIEVPDGWYADLFYQTSQSIEFDPTIADVHTQPFDESGNTVGKVLHVGTSYPRLMVATVDTCNGPRAYSGLVYAYHETITDGFKRLTDDAWSVQVRAAAPADVPWMSDLIAP